VAIGTSVIDEIASGGIAGGTTLATISIPGIGLAQRWRAGFGKLVLEYGTGHALSQHSNSAYVIGPSISRVIGIEDRGTEASHPPGVSAISGKGQSPYQAFCVTGMQPTGHVYCLRPWLGNKPRVSAIRTPGLTNRLASSFSPCRLRFCHVVPSR